MLFLRHPGFMDGMKGDLRILDLACGRGQDILKSLGQLLDLRRLQQISTVRGDELQNPSHPSLPKNPSPNPTPRTPRCRSAAEVFHGASPLQGALGARHRFRRRGGGGSQATLRKLGICTFFGCWLWFWLYWFLGLALSH